MPRSCSRDDQTSPTALRTSSRGDNAEPPTPARKRPNENWGVPGTVGYHSTPSIFDILPPSSTEVYFARTCADLYGWLRLKTTACERSTMAGHSPGGPAKTVRARSIKIDSENIGAYSANRVSIVHLHPSSALKPWSVARYIWGRSSDLVPSIKNGL
jgi:hypothetical protein